MKKILLSLLFACCCVLTASAQDYNIKSAGQGAGGNYLVKITVAMKGKEKGQDAETIVKRYAVHGVMFRGMMAADGYAQQKPLSATPIWKPPRRNGLRLSSTAVHTETTCRL